MCRRRSSIVIKRRAICSFRLDSENFALERYGQFHHSLYICMLFDRWLTQDNDVVMLLCARVCVYAFCSWHRTCNKFIYTEIFNYGDECLLGQMATEAELNGLG